MSDSYRSSDDFISRRKSGYRSTEDTPAMREYREYERQRKEAARLRKLAASSEERKAA